jgi:hypothetical protein
MIRPISGFGDLEIWKSGGAGTGSVSNAAIQMAIKVFG